MDSIQTGRNKDTSTTRKSHVENFGKNPSKNPKMNEKKKYCQNFINFYKIDQEKKKLFFLWPHYDI
jgi:hypothetical protein